MFAELHEEFNSTTSSTKDSLENLRSIGTENAEEFSNVSKEIDEFLKSAQEFIKQLEIEIYSCDKSERKSCQDTVLQCKDTLLNLKSEYNSIVFGKRKSELTNSDTKTSKDKLRSVEATERLSKQSETIQRMHRTIEETVDCGNAINEQLQDNRGRIEQSIDNAREVSALTEKAGKDLKRMNRRTWTLGLF